METKKRGFTIIELIIVLAALAILAAIAVPRLVLVIKESQAAADNASVNMLNNATAAYREMHGLHSGDVFLGLSDDETRMQRLIDEGLLGQMPKPQEDGAAFMWSTENQVWQLGTG